MNPVRPGPQQERDPYRLDREDPLIFEILGEEKFRQLSSVFYGKVYSSENEAFRKMFIEHTPDINDAIQNQYEVIYFSKFDLFFPFLIIKLILN